MTTKDKARVHRYVYLELPVDADAVEGGAVDGGTLHPGQGRWFGPEGGRAGDGSATDGTLADWAADVARNPLIFVPEETEAAPGTSDNPTPGPSQTTFVDTASIDVEAQNAASEPVRPGRRRKPQE